MKFKKNRLGKLFRKQNRTQYLQNMCTKIQSQLMCKVLFPAHARDII